MDEHVQRAVTNGLRTRDVDVLTAQEDGMGRTPDPRLLDRATSLGRVLFSQDRDLLIEASQRMNRGVYFAGLIFLRQHRLSARTCIEQLELLCKASDPSDLANWIEYLPMK